MKKQIKVSTMCEQILTKYSRKKLNTHKVDWGPIVEK